MYIVIFKATISELDEEYSQLAKALHDLAFSSYGCLKFDSFMEGDREVAISYWPSLRHISDWKNDPLHQHAQQRGKAKWYRDYSVEICKLVDPESSS